MSRTNVILLLLGAAFLLSSCAESFHQIQRESDRLGIPQELAQQIDATVAFADLRAEADRYAGRIVAVGGIVLAAKRTKEQTEVEILQLPSKGGRLSTNNRVRSEGRFLAVRREFLDPASVPPGTPITVIGAVTGSTTRLLDDSDYIYPVIEIKHLIDWNTMAPEESDTPSSAALYGSYYHPFGYWGVPYGAYPYWGRPSPYFIQPRPAPRPAPPPTQMHPRFKRR